jgi:hypothetical protein
MKSISFKVGSAILQRLSGVVDNRVNNGFSLHAPAFDSEEELTKTVLHELYRLRVDLLTQAADDVAFETQQAANSIETVNAQSFADRAYKAVFGG